jgi:hypothetical protein
MKDDNRWSIWIQLLYFGLTGCMYRDCWFVRISFVCWLAEHECFLMIFGIMVKFMYDQMLECFLMIFGIMVKFMYDQMLGCLCQFYVFKYIVLYLWCFGWMGSWNIRVLDGYIGTGWLLNYGSWCRD